MTKAYEAKKGVPLDNNFQTHSAGCNQCKQYDEAKPVTVALLCLEGSVLWKRENATPVKREHPDRGQHWANAAEVKRATKYK